MKAIAVNEFGGAERLALMEMPTPGPGAGEALVKLEYAGVNFIDIYMRSGEYARSQTYKTPLPMVIGMEGIGTVVSPTKELPAGTRVAYCIVRGSYAEYAAVPAWKLVKVPDDVPSPIAVTLMLQGLTAHYLSHSAFPLEKGQTCLVHAAAGGVGQLLVQCAKMRGASVIGTAGSAEKAAIAKQAGADHVILYRERDFREEVMRITGGRGVDVVYDAVGKDTIARSIRSIRRRGLCVNYGGASGLVRSIDPLELGEAGSVFFTRPHLADYIATAEELGGRAADLFVAWRTGKLVVTVDREFPLAEAGAAHRYLEAGRTKGKLLLRI
ncbi:MAG: quinone oxidoreductase [Betaproteobacteria bacterium]|nr:quinone oxidoreductase [Betaproteobacteria bacterium]